MNITVESPYKLIRLYFHCVAGDPPDKGGEQARHENHDSGTLSPMKIAVMHDLLIPCTMMNVLMTFIKN